MPINHNNSNEFGYEVCDGKGHCFRQKRYDS